MPGEGNDDLDQEAGYWKILCLVAEFFAMPHK